MQANANTVQAEVEKALGVIFRRRIELTGSSRTDAAVHAKQNYFHFDIDEEALEERWVYNLNALLPADIGVRRLIKVAEGSHCRFDAVYRKYRYEIYAAKDPFRYGLAYYYPYKLNLEAMQSAADKVRLYRNFEAFSKRNSQVKTFECRVEESWWEATDGAMAYCVKANRFLRGMVRGLVGTMLQVGRGRMDVETFGRVLEGRDSARADFSVPGHGLYLEEVGFAEGYFELKEKNI